MNQGLPIVFIVGYDEAVRNSLRLLVKSVGLTATALASLRSSWRATTRCSLVPGPWTCAMPGMSGLELQQRLNLRGAVIPVFHHRAW